MQAAQKGDHVSWRTATIVAAGVSLLSVQAVAQTGEPAPPEDTAQPTDGSAPKTMPNDVGFGQVPLNERWRFADEDSLGARVDRRDAIDASSDRVILWPTAHTPHKNTLAISNHMGALNQVSYSPSDDVQTTASVVVPIDVADTHVALSGKFTVSESDNHVVSIQPFAHHRRSRSSLGGNDTGVGFAGLADVISTDNIILSFGLVGYVTVVAATREFDYTACRTRAEFIRGNCQRSALQTQAFPKGGHFVGAHFGMTWYFHDQWSLRGEAMTGLSAGSVLGSEWLTREFDPEDEGERFRSGPAGVGVPHDTGLAIGGGLQWSNGTLAVQFSGYALTAPVPGLDELREVYLIPMANIGTAFF